MIELNRNINKMPNYVTWIQIVFSSVSKLKMFMKILLMMFKKDLIHQIMKIMDHCRQKKLLEQKSY